MQHANKFTTAWVFKLSGHRTSFTRQPWPQLGHLGLRKTVRTGFYSVDQPVHHLVPSTTNISSILHHHRRHSVHLPHRYNYVERGVVDLVIRIAGVLGLCAMILLLHGLCIEIRDDGLLQSNNLFRMSEILSSSWSLEFIVCETGNEWSWTWYFPPQKDNYSTRVCPRL